jgi:thiosulfate dehydrogenase (quinone) large subunit
VPTSAGAEQRTCQRRRPTGWRRAGAGALLTVMMWTAVLPPTTNPFMDDHLVYAAVLIVLAILGAGNTLGLGRVWTATPLVQRAPWLK